MGKQLSTYRTFTPTILKGKADIPSAGNISEETGYIDCTNISLSAVKSCLGESTYSLYNLCRSDLVNQWSQFNPYIRSYSVGAYPFQTAVLVNTKPTVCKLGDFAGYDHVTFSTPGWQTAPDAEYWVNAGSKVTISAYVYLGDFNYPSTDSNYGLLFVLLDSDKTTVRGFANYQLNTFGHNAYVELESLLDITIDHTDYYIGAYITSDYTETDPMDLEVNVLCIIPNTTLADIDIKVKQQSTLYLDGTLWDGSTDPKTVGNVIFSGISFNVAAGTITFGDLKDSSTGIDGICIHVQVLDWLDNVVSEGNIYDNTDHAMSPDVPPYGAYTSGFWLVFDLTETIRTFDAGALDYTYGYRFLVTVLEHA